MRILFILNNLQNLARLGLFSSLVQWGSTYAELRFAWRIQCPPGTKPEGIFVMERTFKVRWIQDMDLIAATLLNQPGFEVNS